MDKYNLEKDIASDLKEQFENELLGCSFGLGLMMSWARRLTACKMLRPPSSCQVWAYVALHGGPPLLQLRTFLKHNHTRKSSI